MIRVLAVLLLGLLAESALAQGFNRATYLGPDREGFERDYNQFLDHFIDRFSYSALPPWMTTEVRAYRPGARWSGGSVTTNDFSFEGFLGVEKEVGQGFIFRGLVLQSENQDTRYIRNALELGYIFTETVRVFFNVEGVTEKEQIDVSAVFEWEPSPTVGLRAILTAVDLADSKGEEIRYDSTPFAFSIEGWFGAEDGHQLRYDVGTQFPFDALFLETNDDFSFERTIGRIEGRLKAGERDWVVATVLLEWTDKRRADQRIDRNTQEAWVEWWHSFENKREISSGVAFFHKHEDGVQRERRTEWYFVVRMHIPVSENFSLQPQLLAGHGKVDSFGDDQFNGKIGIRVTYHFSPKAEFALSVSQQLDELSFGGGGFVFRTDF